MQGANGKRIDNRGMAGEFISRIKGPQYFTAQITRTNETMDDMIAIVYKDDSGLFFL